MTPQEPGNDMPLYQAIILALVQAFTEFLPISSTAHLILFPWLLGWQDPGLAFDVALHVGTLVALLLYFFRTWIELLLPAVGMHYPASATVAEMSWRRRLFWLLVMGTIPAGLAGLKLEKILEENFRTPIPIACSLIGIALLMWWAETHAARAMRGVEQATLADAIIIGVAQAIALFPGVSRSGITIAAGLGRDMKREAAARFSFLLAAPVLAGAAVHKLPEIIHLHEAGALEMPLSTLTISIAVSGAAGYLVIAWLLRYLQTQTLKIFIYYRLALGIIVLLLVFLHGIPAR
jgi:undecaprenyl-diphosphatase